MVDDGDVVGPEALDETLRPLVQPRGPVELDEGQLRRTVERNSAPPSIRSSSSRRSASDSRSIRVCVGSPGTFSTRKCASAALAICGRCVIVRSCARAGEPGERVGDRVRRPPADAGVDLVEDDRRLPGRGVRDGPQRERDAGELAAGGRLGGGGERQAGVRADEERDAVAPGRARVALRQLDPELAVAHARVPGARRRRPRRRRPPRLARAAESSVASVLHPLLGLRERSLGVRQRIGAGLDLGELGAGRLGAGEQLLGRRRVEAAARVGDPLELLLDRLEPSRLGLERGEERAERRGALADADLRVVQLGRDLAQLGRERGDGLERAGGLGHPLRGAGRALLLGVERLGGGRRGLGELGHVPEPVALGQEPVLVLRLHPLGAGHELGELRESLRAARGRARQLVAAAAGGDQLPPGPLELRPAAKLLLADEGVEDVELVRGPGEAALLELPGHGEKPLDERRQVLPRDGAAPGVRARAPVGEDAPRRHEALLPGRPQLGDRLQLGLVEHALREVELGLDVRLLRPRAEVGGVPGRAEQEPDAPARGSSCRRRSRP